MDDSQTTPCLQAVSGGLKGQTFDISEKGLTVGRHSSNDVRVKNSSASRYHCRLEIEDGEAWVVDLDSQHGTFVNGKKVERERLSLGDEVAIASTVFVLIDEAQSPTTLELTVDEGFYRQPELLLSEAEGILGVRERVLLQATLAIGELRAFEPLVDRLLELVLEAVPTAERAALLFYDRAGDERTRQRTKRPGGNGQTESAVDSRPLSRTVVERTLRDRVALVIEDLSDTSRDWGESLAAQEVKTFVGVPLLDLHQRAVGLLYLDSASQPRELERGQLEFLTAFAGLTSAALSNLLQFEWLTAERERLHQREIGAEMIGESEAMKKVFALVERVASTDTTVLLLGESGSGKELAAKAIHRASERAGRPFVAINCAALSESLLESELFGHEKGAFTGADRRKSGRLEIAASGTLFLDEIGEMAPGLQAKLLRVLEERTFERVGGNHPIEADLRVIAATNRDLQAAIKSGDFREDLYYRLNVLSITLPPLRDRKTDVMLLADHLRLRFSETAGRPVQGFTPAAKRALEAYSWPGNVRQLSNAIERAVVLVDSDRIDVHDLPEELHEVAAVAAQSGSYQEVLRETKRRLIKEAVLAKKGRYTEAAKALDLHPNYLHRLIRNLELKAELEDGLRSQG